MSVGAIRGRTSSIGRSRWVSGAMPLLVVSISLSRWKRSSLSKKPRPIGACANTVDEIAALAASLDADLICVGSRGLGPVRRLVLGSVSEGLVHTADRPVLIMRGGEDAWPPAHLVIGDDGSDDAVRAADLAVSRAPLFDASATLVRALPEKALAG